MRNRDENREKRPTWGSLIGILFAIAMISTEWFILLLSVCLLVIPIWLIIRTARKSAKKPKEPRFDDCPKPICLHTDRGEHHLRRGREIDPWDRPDIDISKYQRK